MDMVRNVYCHLLYHSPEKDETVSSDDLKSLQNAMEESGKTLDLQTYPGTLHGFFNNARPDLYDETASSQAWTSTLDFLKKHLPPPSSV